MPALIFAAYFARAVYTLLRCFLTISMKCEAFSGQSVCTVVAEAQKYIFFAYSIKNVRFPEKMRKTVGVNGVLQVPRYLAPLSGALFSSTWRPTIPTAYIAPSDNLGFHSGFAVVFVLSWPFPSQKCILAVTGLRPFPGPGEGGAQKANSTRCFLWCLLFLGRFPRKNQAWLSLRPIGSSWDDPGAPSHLCRIAVYSR